MKENWAIIKPVAVFWWNNEETLWVHISNFVFRQDSVSQLGCTWQLLFRVPLQNNGIKTNAPTYVFLCASEGSSRRCHGCRRGQRRLVVMNVEWVPMCEIVQARILHVDDDFPEKFIRLKAVVIPDGYLKRPLMKLLKQAMKASQHKLLVLMMVTGNIGHSSKRIRFCSSIHANSSLLTDWSNLRKGSAIPIQ